MPSIFEIKYLPTFLEVCQQGTIGRATGTLHKTQPAISYEIKMLERQLGTPLFERGGRTLILTPGGRRLHDFCIRALGEFRLLKDALATGAAAPRPLHVGSVSGFGRYVLGPVLRTGRFRRRALGLRFQTAEEVLASVEAGAADIGFVYRLKVSNYLRFEPVYREELVLIAPPSPPPPRALHANAYRAVPFVTYDESDYVFGRWFDSLFGEPPAATTSCAHFTELEEVVDAVADGRGCSIVPLDAVAAAVRRRRVQLIRPGRRRCFNTVFAVRRAGSVVEPDVEALCREVERRGPGALEAAHP
jgi:DNA-binding transcriptional LysR family regulator